MIATTNYTRHFWNSPNELQRMLLHGWVFCEHCGRKVNVEDLVEYYCPECAFLLRNKNRTKTQQECKAQKTLLHYTAPVVLSQPEGSASIVKEE